MTELQQALVDAMKQARKKPGGLEAFLRDLRLSLLAVDEPSLAELLRREKK